MTFDYSIGLRFWSLFAEGLAVTFLVSAAALAAGLVLGLALAAARLARGRVWRAGSLAVVELVRNLPFIVLLFILFFGLPPLGVHVPSYLVGIIALGLYAAAYYAEIYRGAIGSVPGGQWEAARSLGLARRQTLARIVLPQMLRYFIPPATNQAIMLIKESAVLSTITVVDLTMAAQIVQSTTFRPLEVFVIVSLLYWALTEAVARLGAFCEKRCGQRFAR
jgi:polar amino acid transport system permease protein